VPAEWSRHRRVRGHAEDVDVAGGGLDHEYQVDSPQCHRAVDVKKSHASVFCAWVRRNCLQVSRSRLVGEGSAASSAPASHTTSTATNGRSSTYDQFSNPTSSWSAALAGAENLCHQAIFVNHASGTVTPPDTFYLQGSLSVTTSE
jgi:hypothetical protein